MQTLIFLLVGFKEYGRNSFINTLAGKNVSEVGSDSSSQSIGVNSYDLGESKIIFKNGPPDSRFTIINPPGFQDPNIKAFDKNITDLINYKVFELGKDTIDIVLLFESAISSSITIRPALNILVNTFGESIIQSTVGVVTKWDRLNDSEKILKKAALSDFTQFPLVEWINDTDDNKISVKLKSSQTENLSSAIKGRKSYKLSNIKKLDEECDSLAKKMQEKDNDRFEIKKECFTLKVPVSRVVQEEYIDYEKSYKTEAEIRKRAEELRINAGKYPVKKVRQKTEEYDEEYYVIERKSREIPYRCNGHLLFFTISPICYKYVWDDIKVPKYRRASRKVPEEYTEYELYPIENFIVQAMGETKSVTKYRQKTINETKEEKECRDIQYEKHNFLYYREKAKQEMAKNFRNLFRK